MSDPSAFTNLTQVQGVVDKATSAVCGDVNNFFFLVVGGMVFMMQMGFAMLEYSAVHPYHGSTVLLKNLMDVCIAGITWWLVGNGVSGGTDASGFIGTAEGDGAELFESVGGVSVKDGFLTGTNGYASWFFGFAFAATAATIVSGAVAERTQFSAYFVYSIVLTAFVYPVVAHWIWLGGWLNQESMIDFAGSGVVHMTGGVAALWGAAIVGPRKFMATEDGCKPRFEKGGIVNDHKYAQRGLPFGVLGTIVLWFGWYGFNPGSVLGVCGVGDLMGTAIVTTTISPAAAAITGCVYDMIFKKVKGVKDGPDPVFICNCILAGLVGITAGAGTLENWAAFVTGVISTFVYVGSSKLLKLCKVDDVIDAFPVHGACGAWGLIATGLFSSNRLAFVFARDYLGVDKPFEQNAGLFYDGSALIGWQLAAVGAIFLWVSAIMIPIFLILRFTGFLRLNEEAERTGHGKSTEFLASSTNLEMVAKDSGADYEEKEEE